MHVTVSACFLIRFALQCRKSADFIYRCIIFLNRTSAVKKYHAPVKKLADFQHCRAKLIRNFLWALVHKTTYAPVNITATCIIVSCGQIKYSGGLGLGTLDICGPQIAQEACNFTHRCVSS